MFTLKLNVSENRNFLRSQQTLKAHELQRFTLKTNISANRGLAERQRDTECSSIMGVSSLHKYKGILFSVTARQRIIRS